MAAKPAPTPVAPTPAVRSARTVSPPRAGVSVLLMVVLLGAMLFLSEGPLGRGKLLGTLGSGQEQGSTHRQHQGQVASTNTSAGYSFIVTRRSGTRAPVTFDPCRPIHLVVNAAHAPTGADLLLRQAVARVNEHSGLQLVVDGETTESPSARRPARDVRRYGRGWSPALVAWTTPETVPGLKGDVAGLAGPVEAPHTITLNRRLVTGTVYLDGPAITDVIDHGPEGWAAARAIVMHELAHLVGLGHVDVEGELMHPSGSTSVTEFGAGDREGLRLAGSGHCS